MPEFFFNSFHISSRTKTNNFFCTDNIFCFDGVRFRVMCYAKYNHPSEDEIKKSPILIVVTYLIMVASQPQFMIFSTLFFLTAFFSVSILKGIISSKKEENLKNTQGYALKHEDFYFFSDFLEEKQQKKRVIQLAESG